MWRVMVFALAVAGAGAAALAQQANIPKGVACATLSQQFGDSVKAAKVEDGVKTAATDLAKQGDQACNAHDYDAGLDQLRQAIVQIGLKPVR
jgi:hypothetical protein